MRFFDEEGGFFNATVCQFMVKRRSIFFRCLEDVRAVTGEEVTGFKEMGAECINGGRVVDILLTYGRQESVCGSDHRIKSQLRGILVFTLLQVQTGFIDKPICLFQLHRDKGDYLSSTLTDTGFELVIFRVASVYIEFRRFLVGRNLIVLGQDLFDFRFTEPCDVIGKGFLLISFRRVLTG